MFAKINRGSRMAGLLVYVAGPGRAEEHVDPHVVAGSPAVELRHVGERLDRDKALRLARWIDGPARATGDAPRRGVYARAEAARDSAGVRTMVREKVGETDAHVYQIALSARAEEGELGDDTWAQIARSFIDRMGIAQAGGETARTTRWVAVHHGRSVKGNDHIHLIVNLAREDGTSVDTHQDFRRAKAACRQIEDEFGLMPLHPNAYELARTYARATWEAARRAEMAAGDPAARMPWAELDTDRQHALMAAECGSQAEWQAALADRDKHATVDGSAGQTHRGGREALGRARARADWEKRRAAGQEHRPWGSLSRAERDRLIGAATPAEDPRTSLARTVRGAAAAAADEAEFVRRLRRAGLLARPRYATGRTDVVAGYSVAERPPRGARPIWYGGGRLARDLTLPKLRAGWTDTPQTAGEAVAEWTAARRGDRVTTTGREAATPSADQWAHCDERLGRLRERLHAVPADDADTWAAVAREASGALAAYSRATEPEPGDLAAASDALARSARTWTPTRRGPQNNTGTVGQMAMLLAAAGRGGSGAVMQAMMISRLLGLAQAIYDAEIASADARAARTLAEDTRTRLVRVRAALPQAKRTQLAEEREGAAEAGAHVPERAREAQHLAWLGQGRPATEATKTTAGRTDPRPARRERGRDPGRDDGRDR